jgi:hypothetical protein
LLKGLCKSFETIGDARQGDLADRRSFGRPMRGFVQIVGEHERYEQHRAFGAEPPGGAVRDRPAFGEHRAEQADARFLAVATRYRMRAATDI